MEGKWRNVERDRSQAISHGVSTPKKQIGPSQATTGQSHFLGELSDLGKGGGVAGDPLHGHICLKVSLFLWFPARTLKEGGKCFLHE